MKFYNGWFYFQAAKNNFLSEIANIQGTDHLVLVKRFDRVQNLLSNTIDLKSTGKEMK